MKRRWLVLCCVPLWLLAAVACWSGAPTPELAGGPLVTPVPPGATEVPYVAPPTATAWPTFTPLPSPTPTPTPGPTFTPSPVPVVTPTRVVVYESPTGVPTVVLPPVSTPAGPVVDPTAAPSAAPVVAGPSPTPYGRLAGVDDGEALFRHQTLFPSAVAALPDLYITGDPADLPRGADFISQMTPFVIWVVVYDTTEAVDDWEMNGTVRWMDLNGGPDPLVMVSAPVRLTKADFMFTQGLGQALPGFWKAGRTYRVEFLDESHEVAVSWDFEVR